ncbi:putative nuclease HARBI1 [Anabrus simplex]|uniref:putative nuclease HARBI1 n=1 Tax=Anabrus simplex TaxID=316456 RepID=UPI0035A2E31A
MQTCSRTPEKHVSASIRYALSAVNMASSSEDDVLLYMWLKLRNKRKRKWIHDFNMSCAQHGAYTLAHDLLKDPVKFQSYYRMYPESYTELLQKISPLLRKQDTNYRKAISPDEKLLITLRYLATGNSFRCLSFQFKRGETTIGKIVDEVCSAVWTTLQPEFMPAPSKELWENISERYLELWNMPNCIGAIDGKHVRIQCPRNSGSSFYNYKGYFSIVLLALVDADGLFIVIEAGDYGRNSDGGVLRNSALGRNLQQGTLNIPDPKRLPKDDDHCSPFPYFFVGDEAFPLQKHIMRPYPRRELTNERRIFNYRLSRARKSVECGFGMLASKFRVLGTAIACKPDKIDNIIRAICVLHNFIRLKDGVFSEPSVTDKDENTDNTMRVLQRLQPCNRRATVEAAELRNHLCSYFMKPNVALSWQNKYAIE